MADSTSAKPRVLLSILKGEGFDALGDTSDLFTTIIAGFGRFECERVLKPSGVELMNLAQSAIIEISVQRRSRDTGQGSLLYRGRVPLAALHPSFFGKVASEGVAHVEPQIWESWLGLFSADISLKGQTPERIFQQCVEMGNSQVRTSPRLYLRLQYLQAGATAGPKVAPGTGPSIANAPQANMEMSMRGHMNTNVQQAGGLTPKAFGTGGLLTAAGSELSTVQEMPTTGTSSGGGTPSGGGTTSSVRLQRSAVAAVRSMSPSGVAARAGSPTPPLGAAARSPPTALASGSPPAPQSWQGPRGASTRVDAAEVLIRPSLSPSSRVDASGENPFVTVPSGIVAAPVGGGVNWRAKYEELTQVLELTKAQHNEKVAILERATRSSSGQEQSELRSRRELLEVEATELRQMVADLRLSKEEIEQQNARLHAEGLAREDTLNQFFEKVSPALSGLGWPLRMAPAEAAASADSAASQLSQVVAALADTLAAPGGSGGGGDAPSALSAEETGLLGEAVWQAVEGGEATFEDWFSRQLDAPARAKLANSTRLLSGCRQAAALRNTVIAVSGGAEDAPGSFPITGPFYVPVKTDPVDLMVASTLLRLGTDQAAGASVATAAAGLLRLEPGMYRLEPDGLSISCFMEAGQVMVLVPSGNSNEAQAEPIELSEFLASRDAVGLESLSAT